MIGIEDYLKEVCSMDDWDKLEDDLKDYLKTSNVIKYIKDYAELVLEEAASRADADITWINPEVKNLKLIAGEDYEVYVLNGSITNLIKELK